MPAATLTPKTGSKKGLAKNGKVDASRDKGAAARSLETGRMPQNLSKFCTNCGTKFHRNTYRFCGDCGHVRSTIVN